MGVKNNKQNPILAAFEAKLRREFAEEKAQMEANYQQRLSRNTEINLIAMLIAGSDLGFVGPKRADLLLVTQLETKKKLAEDVVQDSKSDITLTYTKADLTRRLKQILGPDGWNSCKELFPLLYEYWD
jgi:hypothetical protein